MSNSLKTKAILFDIDGTLLDTTELIFRSYEHTLPMYGFKIAKREKISPLIGGSLKKIYEILAPGGDFELIHKTHTNFQLKNFHLTKIFPDVLETLLELKKRGYKIAAITSRHKDTLFHSLKHAKIDKLFDLIISADDVKNHKPHPEPVIKALKMLKVKKDEAIMVGDALPDIEAAKAAGVKTVAVTYGFGKNLKKLKPDYLIDKISDLKNIL